MQLHAVVQPLFGGLAGLFVLLALALTSAAQDPLSKPVVYRLPGMDSVRVEEGIVYKRADGAALTMSVAAPAAATKAAASPVIIFIHGGPLGRTVGREPTDWGVYRSYVRLAAASGFVGVAFNFRYYDLTEEGLARAVSDVADAISYVQNNASTFHADPRRICLWTFSGGGPMLTVALEGRHQGIRCLVSYYALLEPGTETGGRYSLVSHPLPDGQAMPPIFIGRAGLDSPEINRTVDAFVARAEAEGLVFTVANHPAGRHGFDIEDADQRSQEIIASTFDFVRAHTTGVEPSPEARLGRKVATLYNSMRRGDTQTARRLADPVAWPGAEVALLERVTAEETIVRVWYQLAHEGAREKALGLLEWLVERHADSATAFNRLADAYEAAGRREDSRKATERVLQLLERVSDPETRAALRKAATERLERLSKGR